jgi:hypothetical protein
MEVIYVAWQGSKCDKTQQKEMKCHKYNQNDNEGIACNEFTL